MKNEASMTSRKRLTGKQAKQDMKASSKDKHRICYTCRSKGHFSKDCDEDISTTYITIPPILIQGPITRSRARQLKQQVNSFLCFSSYENENRLLPNDVIVLRKLGEDLGQVGEHHGGGKALQGRPHQVGGLVQLNLEPTSVSRSSVH